MAEGNVHPLYPEGRRHPAPPRRLPPPANDNRAPARERVKRILFMTAVAAMAVSLALNALPGH